MKFLKTIYYEKYTKKSYAISNVDLIIDRIFANKKKGVYIDVGSTILFFGIIHIFFIKKIGAV